MILRERTSRVRRRALSLLPGNEHTHHQALAYYNRIILAI